MSSEQPTAAGFGRRVFPIAAKLAVSIVLLAILLSRVDMAGLLASARSASIAWLLVALGLYGVTVAAATWRWHLLLDLQDVQLPRRTLLGSYLVANFFNNFLPSNIGGDVVRIRDTARPAGSKTLATTIVLVDRILGLMGLVLVAALGATMAATAQGQPASPIWPSWLWAGFIVAVVVTVPALMAPVRFSRLLQPLTIVHPTWVGERIDKFTAALVRFRERPIALAGCFTAAVAVQALLVVYYLAVVYALHIQVTALELAVIVPISFVVQLLPISVNGFGVREAAFSVYFARLHLPIQSAVLLSLMATVLIMFFSLTGAAVYVSRGR